jgi:ribonuclease HII
MARRSGTHRRGAPRSRGGTLRCTTRFEDEAHGEGFRWVAGLDEVGRGALCGPVVAGAVILGAAFDTEGIDDSKKLTARQREILAERVRAGAVAWAIGVADVEEIDRLNVLQATYRAMERALSGLRPEPDFVLVDAVRVPQCGAPQRPIVKGDAQSVSIAAASIVAKVARDAMMREIDGKYPGYGLARNMGYGSQHHREALRRMGPSEIHRRTFHGTQRWLFWDQEPRVS